MHQLQLIYDRQAKTKQEIRELKAMAAEALEKNPKYQELLAAYNQAKSDLNIVRDQILEGYQKDLEKLDVLKTDVNNDRELMTDEAIKSIAEGWGPAEVTYKGVTYQAEFSVRFKKKQ